MPQREMEDTIRVPHQNAYQAKNSLVHTVRGTMQSEYIPRGSYRVRTTRHQWAGTTEVHEAQGDFTGTTARLELGEPWTDETLFKLHPSQTRGRYDGLLAEDYSPLEPPGTAIQLRPLPSPKEPAPSERELHNLTHLQHRRWCPACVSAKAKESPRYQHTDKLPAIQLGYMFVSTKGTNPTP